MVPDQYEARQIQAPRFGVFGTTLIAFFLLEMDDKTQIATLALAAKYSATVAVIAGTTPGMMLANVLAVLAGAAAATRLTLKLTRSIAALLLLVMGVVVLFGVKIGLA